MKNPCIECKYYSPEAGDTEFGSRCLSPKMPMQIDPVTGIEKHYLCSVARMHCPTLNFCGPNGKFFVPKNSQEGEDQREEVVPFNPIGNIFGIMLLLFVCSLYYPLLKAMWEYQP